MYIATYETSQGSGYIKKFTSKAKANDWLRSMHEKHAEVDEDGFEESFKEWKRYGTFTAKVWKV